MTDVKQEILEILKDRDMSMERKVNAILNRFCVREHLFHGGCDTTVYACHKEGVCDRCGRRKQEER